MKTTDRLFAAAKDIWDKYYFHPFIQGICDGTLDEAKFRHYVVQDYLYLVDYAKVFAIGAAKAPTLEYERTFLAFAKGILDGELKLHDGYTGLLNITREELDRTPMSIDNAGYVAYMLRVAYEEGIAGVLAAILSCAVSYEKIGKRIAAEHPESMEHPLYGEWVKEYASEAYAHDNYLMIDMLDELTADWSEDQLAHIERIFVDCSRYEYKFWDLGWNMD